MSTPFAFGAALLTLLAVGLVLAPFLRRRPAAIPGDDHRLAVGIAQLAEIDRDLARGIIGTGEAAAARTEIKRRLLAIADAAPAAGTALGRAGGGGGESGAAPRRAALLPLAGLVAVFVPALAIALYLAVGSPGSGDRPLAARQATGDLADRGAPAETVRSELAETVARLERFLAERPGEANGWLLLGRAYLTLDRPLDAVAALERARALAADRADIAAALGEALIVAAGGRVEPPAEAVLREALAADPFNVQARFYLALARAQEGDRHAALQGWIDVLALSPPDAPWRAEVEQRAAEVAAGLGVDWRSQPPSAALRALVGAAPPAAGPDAADREAAARMAPEERARMIEGMVERLAARLRDHPDDREGWERLARAYEVLGQPEKAAAARDQAGRAGPPSVEPSPPGAANGAPRLR